MLFDDPDLSDVESCYSEPMYTSVNRKLSLPMRSDEFKQLIQLESVLSECHLESGVEFAEQCSGTRFAAWNVPGSLSTKRQTTEPSAEQSLMDTGAAPSVRAAVTNARLRQWR